MSTGTDPDRTGTEVSVTGTGLETPASTTVVPQRKGSLPRWAPWALLGAAAVVMAGVVAAMGSGVGLWVVLTVVVYAVGTYGLSRGVEGARKAMGHAYGGGSQYYSMWVVSADKR